jgi:dipeptidase E
MTLPRTSAGIKNPSIRDALAEPSGEPIAGCRILGIPTGIYPFPGGPGLAHRCISGATTNHMCELGWRSPGVPELTGRPGIKTAYWSAAVRETDALLVYGGDALYLCRRMRESESADLPPSPHGFVYVGVSVGSMVTAPIFGETDDAPERPSIIATGRGLVGFAPRPHPDHAHRPESSAADLARMAAEVPVPTYAIDDETAIELVDGTVDVVSDGYWRRFNR